MSKLAATISPPGLYTFYNHFVDNRHELSIYSMIDLYLDRDASNEQLCPLNSKFDLDDPDTDSSISPSF